MNLYPYQLKLLEGIAKGEMVVMTAGRQVGKSMVNQLLLYKHMMENTVEIPFFVKDSAIVDGEKWYTVRCTDEVGRWVRTQSKDIWSEHIDQKWHVYRNTFDMHEKLLTMLNIKWSSE